ncbi:receptor-like protein 4 [Camellia sinensis]|uniref:receptor-like protein 4 n=1 Tax=Camellia sinensis TaxID=4442 RepID=UPI00103584E2|nr:receptor-like protein 4 [Camellia sinensis]
MSPLYLLPFFFFFFFFFFPSLSLSYLFNTVYHIDCGGSTDSTDNFNTTWLSDRFFTSGSSGLVSEPLRFRSLQEKTLRFFPISSGKKNCYIVPLPTGRFYIRTFTVYDNYDGKSHSPSFDLSVEGTLVFSWRSPWPEQVSRIGAYSDLFAFVSDGEADICFYSIATDSPIIASLELIQIDPASYDSASIGNGSVLVNYGRLSSGSEQWGPGFSNDVDLFGRTWQSDAEFRSPNSVEVKAVSAIKNVVNTDQSPNYFPVKLYQTALMGTGNGALEYELPVDAKLDYLLWFHFAEIDVSVNRQGQRVFDVVVNGENMSRVDIFKQVGSFAAYDWYCTVKNLSSTILSVKLVPVVGVPIICGLENYAIVPADLSTVPDQVVAMSALKESLRVPDRMGWNGDPCAPTNWDAWEGVTCHPNKDETALVIFQIDLGSQGLKGYISDQIGLLTNLVSLNLSSNSLGSSLPSGLGLNSLKKLDLSNNRFTGSIPDSLVSSNLQLVILNDNSLEGQVPEGLYSIGVHGGAIDLSGNKGLCGVPSLPECPLFWRRYSLSTGGKIAIGISAVVMFCILLLVIYMCCIRRGHHDYDFALPQELMALSAKRNRYHRQKSLMTLEMESQHAKGFISNLNSN